MPERIVPVPAPPAILRDLGGIPVDGGRISPRPAAMRSMLAALDISAGGAVAALRAGGPTSDLAGRLHRRPVQPVPAQV